MHTNSPMAPDPTYDVFLSHASPDKPQVEDLARRLKRRKLKPFLDKWHLVPGEPWQEALQEALKQSRTFVVFLGPSGIRPWQNEEMWNALDMRVRDDSRRVIPVLLPGASMPELPPFLARLTWVDFRNGLDDPKEFRRLVSGIRGTRPGAGKTSSPPPSSRPLMVGVPHRNPYFTGRETLLARLHQKLQTQGTSVLAQAAIHGLGGIGKTQTAIEYAYRFGEHYRFVLWAPAESETSLRTAYLSIARELGLVEPQADLATAVFAVKAWLSREDGWLLVFDNADNPALVRPCLPSARTGGKALLTSRAKSFAKAGIREPFRVETLDPKEAAKFLTERTGNPDSQAAEVLAAELGYLPLALEQAAAYIETVGGGFTEYLARYRRQGVALLESGKPSTDYSETVATTWTLSFEAVRQASPASAELLTAAAFLVADSVPIEIFTLGGSELGDMLAQSLKGADEDPLGFWQLFEHLERYSLLERLPDKAFKLHRLTQTVVRDSLGEEGRRVWANRLVRALNAVYPEVEFENWKLCERLQPHARRASELTRTYQLNSAEAGRLFSEAGNFARARGDYAESKFFREVSLAIRKLVLGGEHPDTLTSMNNLAVALGDLGDLAGARSLHEQTLEIRRRVLGEEHTDTLKSRDNLGLVLHALGRAATAGIRALARAPRTAGGALFIAAKELQEKNLEIFVRVKGAQHSYTLKSRNNLAVTLVDLEDFAEARKLHEENLEVRERVLGYEHPETLNSRMNLAETLRFSGDLAEARKLHEQTLEVRERVLLVHNHPDTTSSAWYLLLTVRALNEPETEAQLIDKLRWLLDCDEASLPSAVHRDIRQKLLDFLNPS